MQYSYELFIRELGTKIKQMRKDRGWSLRDMVIEHRVHLTQWQRLESGKGISTTTLLRICEVFNVGLAQLVEDLGQVRQEAEPAIEPVEKSAKLDSPPTKLARGPKKTGTRKVG